jgi:hypothetical protein
VIVINDGSKDAKVHFKATGKTATAIQVFQSKQGSYYKTVTVSTPTRSVS